MTSDDRHDRRGLCPGTCSGGTGAAVTVRGHSAGEVLSWTRAAMSTLRQSAIADPAWPPAPQPQLQCQRPRTPWATTGWWRRAPWRGAGVVLPALTTPAVGLPRGVVLVLPAVVQVQSTHQWLGVPGRCRGHVPFLGEGSPKRPRGGERSDGVVDLLPGRQGAELAEVLEAVALTHCPARQRGGRCADHQLGRP